MNQSENEGRRGDGAILEPHCGMPIGENRESKWGIDEGNGEESAGWRAEKASGGDYGASDEGVEFGDGGRSETDRRGFEIGEFVECLLNERKRSESGESERVFAWNRKKRMRE